MNLYLLTCGLGDFYVLAPSPNDAQAMLEARFERQDYGFSKDRQVTNIKLLAEELYEWPDGKTNFSSGHRLLTPDTKPIL